MFHIFIRLLLASLVLLSFKGSCRGPRSSGGGRESVATPQGRKELPAGAYDRRVTVDGRERSYLLHIPEGLNFKEPAPLILAFHGGFGTPKNFAEWSGLSARAGSAGFVVVYPEGYRRSWNAGDCCGPAQRENVNDIAFVRSILDDLTTVVNYDQRRVYATGFSNGAKLTFRLACELPGRLAAIGTAGAAISIPDSQCRPARLPPLLHFHGSADKFAPYEGGQSTREQAGWQRSVRETIRIWRDRDGCADEPQPVYQKGSANCVEYSKCQRRADITVCTIEGMGHQWPGAEALFPRLLGSDTNDISATEMIVNFFIAHPGAD